MHRFFLPCFGVLTSNALSKSNIHKLLIMLFVNKTNHVTAITFHLHLLDLGFYKSHKISISLPITFNNPIKACFSNYELAVSNSTRTKQIGNSI